MLPPKCPQPGFKHFGELQHSGFASSPPHIGSTVRPGNNCSKNSLSRSHCRSRGNASGTPCPTQLSSLQPHRVLTPPTLHQSDPRFPHPFPRSIRRWKVGIPQIFPTRQRRPRVTRAEGREAPEPAKIASNYRQQQQQQQQRGSDAPRPRAVRPPSR